MSNDQYLDGEDMEMERIDPDIALIADYLALELDEHEAKRVFQRLVSDDAFYRKAQPLMMLLGAPHLDLRVVQDAPVAAPARIQLVADAVPESTPTPTTGSQRRRRRLPPWASRSVIPWVARGAVAIGIAFGGFELAAAHVEDGEKIVSKWWLERVGAAADSTSTQSQLLPGSSLVTLDRNSQVHVVALPGGNEALVQLQGGATFNVANYSRVITVSTSGGDALLTPGRYHVQATGRTMEVRVDRGSARLIPRGETRPVDVKAGETKKVP